MAEILPISFQQSNMATAQQEMALVTPCIANTEGVFSAQQKKKTHLQSWDNNIYIYIYIYI